MTTEPEEAATPAVDDIPDSDDLPEDEEPKAPETGHQYQGSGERTYPFHRHPETGAPLVVGPGESLDFGELSPPADGLWYDVSSGEPYVDSPASTGAGETEE